MEVAGSVAGVVEIVAGGRYDYCSVLYFVPGSNIPGTDGVFPVLHLPEILRLDVGSCGSYHSIPNVDITQYLEGLSLNKRRVLS